MIQQVIDQWQKKAATTRLCRLLGVSRSGVHAARRRRQAPRVCALAAPLQAAFQASGGHYGSRRLCAALKAQGLAVGRHRVRCLMKRQGLKARWKRKFTHTTDSRHDLPTAANVLDRRFNPGAPDQAWVADITYIRTWTGWLYLATVIDCCTRQVIGWSMATHMRTTLICDAVTMAAGRSRLQPEAIFHSDRGAQYSSAEFAAHLRAFNLRGSMGRVGQCWDNALAESFFASLKNELVHRTVFPTQEKARRAVAEYIEVFYTRTRVHSALGYKTPAQAAAKYHGSHATAA